MSRSASDFLPPEDRGRLACSACQRCCHRKDCFYSSDRILKRALRRAASQGQAAAQRLTAEAGRLHAEVSRADDAGRLLRADEALERALSDILCSEIDSIKGLSLLCVNGGLLE